MLVPQALLPTMHLNKSVVFGWKLPLLALAVATFALYGNFLNSPIVFDDIDFFVRRHPEYLDPVFSFRLRWLPYASFEWTRMLFGESLYWLRLGNLLLHVCNGFLLFLFLRRLFELVLHPDDADRSLLAGMAFFGALLFVLHPAAVYGTAYLIQRTILMATLFSLLALGLFIRGLDRNDRKLMWLSALAYLFAGLAKEHAVLLPALVVALALLLRPPTLDLWRQLVSPLLLYGIAAAFIIYQSQSSHIITSAYEPNGVDVLALLGIPVQEAYPLSVLTQGLLFFKYLLLWIVPNPASMAIDMRAGFASGIWVWPETGGFVAFVLYGLISLALLLMRGRFGLLGFGMLAPWLVFAVELSTVRIQEIFVIYRSYLWMPYLAAALPFLLQKLSFRPAMLLLGALALSLVPLSHDRLKTFSDPVLLWSDALRLAQEKRDTVSLGRIYHNLGIGYLQQGDFAAAIRNFDQGIERLPMHKLLYHDRAAAYLWSGRHMDALNDFDVAIRLDSRYLNAYRGRARTYEELGNLEAAYKDYENLCLLGEQEACGKMSG